jgi:hypothetical protein
MHLPTVHGGGKQQTPAIHKLLEPLGFERPDTLEDKDLLARHHGERARKVLACIGQKKSINKPQQALALTTTAVERQGMKHTSKAARPKCSNGARMHKNTLPHITSALATTVL